MKQQIIKILEALNLSPAQFADYVGVQRSSISHILSGRNKPSYDFILKILEKYPEVSADWLLTGSGSMFKPKSENNSVNTEQNLFSQSSKQVDNTIKNTENKDFSTIDTSNQDSIIRQKTSVQNAIKNSEVTNVNNIRKVIFIYDNNTFEEINKK